MTMMLKKIRELRAERIKKVNALRKINETAEAEKRSFSAEEQQSWDKLEAEVRADKQRIDKLEFLLEEERAEKRATDRKIGSNPIKSHKEARNRERAHDRRDNERRDQRGKVTQEQALAAWLTHRSENPASQRMREAMREHRFWGPNINVALKRGEELRHLKAIAQMPRHMRTMSTTTGNQGGFTVPTGLINQIEIAMLARMELRQVATVLRTSTGESLGYPTTNDTAQEGEIIGQNTENNAQDVAFGQAALSSYKFSSKIVKVPYELMRDSVVDLEALLSELLTDRIARIQTKKFTIGSGTGEPQGFMTAAATGKTAALTNAIAADELLDLIYSVGEAYRVNGVLMTADTTTAALMKLKSSDNNYLFQPSAQDGQPDRFFGYRHVTNDYIEAIAADKKVAAFGDFSKVLIRDAGTVRMRRLEERYAEFDQVGFLMFWHSDAKLLNAGTNPIKVLKTAAS